jgi:hypothetical protein
MCLERLSMNDSAFVAALALALSLTSPVYGIGQPLGGSDLVEIDGAKQPDRVPQWVVWRETLGMISSYASQKSQFTASLWGALSVEERRTVEKVAVDTMAKYEGCLAAGEESLTRLPRNTQADVMKRELTAARVKCRQLVIDARDDVKPHLADMSWLSLYMFSQERLPGIRMYVSRDGLDDFYKPQ